MTPWPLNFREDRFASGQDRATSTAVEVPKRRTGESAMFTTARSAFTVLLIAAAWPVAAAEIPPALAPLQGKWSAARTNAEGRRYSHVIEIKGDRLTFQIVGEDERVRFFAQGKVKADTAGPLKVLAISDIQAGRSADEVEAVDDTRTSVYTLRDGRLIFASNFDRERDNESPRVDIYERASAARAAAPSAAAGDEARLLGQWKVDVSLNDQSYDYALRFSKTDGKLAAVLVSPRSGEHKARSVVWRDGELTVELDRTLDGNNVTFVYQGRFSGDRLSGKVAVKGFEDQFSGQWKAEK
jgi:hypothetical protein